MVPIASIGRSISFGFPSLERIDGEAMLGPAAAFARDRTGQEEKWKQHYFQRSRGRHQYVFNRFSDIFQDVCPATRSGSVLSFRFAIC